MSTGLKRKSGCTSTAEILPDEARLLLASLDLALDVPEPDFTVEDEQEYASQIARRLHDIRAALREVAVRPYAAGTAAAVKDLVIVISERPLTYTPSPYVM